MSMTRESHATHDAYLVAQLAADDLTGPDRAAAQQLVADCPRCADLFADLAAMTSAIAQLPPPVRTRDFRLTPADAARLRSPWRRWFGGLAQPRFAFAQPLGAALATFGLAGLLVGVLPGLSVSLGSPASAPAPVPALDSQAPPAPSAAVGGVEKSTGESAVPTAGQPGPTAAPTIALAAPASIALAAPSTEPARNPSVGAPPVASGAVRTTASSSAPNPSAANLTLNPRPTNGAAPIAGTATTTAPPTGFTGDGAASPGPTTEPVGISSTAIPPTDAAPPTDVVAPSGGTAVQAVPFNASANPSAEVAASPASAASPAVGGAVSDGTGGGSAGPDSVGPAPASPGLGVITGITRNPTRDGSASGDSTTGGPQPLIVFSIALLLAGLILFVARRSAVRATR